MIQDIEAAYKISLLFNTKETVNLCGPKFMMCLCRFVVQDLWVEVEKLAMVVMETREEMRRMKGTAKTLLNQLSEEQKKNAALSDAQQTMEMQLIELTKWFQETLISRNKVIKLNALKANRYSFVTAFLSDSFG